MIKYGVKYVQNPDRIFVGRLLRVGMRKKFKKFFD